MIANGLAEVGAAAVALSSALERAKRHAGGAVMRDFPYGLEQALRAALGGWQQTPGGRAALGLAPLPTHAENVIATARADVGAAEDLLRRCRAIPAVEATLADRRARIEAAGLALVAARKRLADLEPNAGAQFKSWLRGFSVELRAALAAPVIERGASAQLARLDERDAAEARRADPLGAALADAGLPAR